MPQVTFELTVDVDEEMVEDGRPVETAKEIMYSAPGFDGISGDAIDMLEVSSVVPELDDFIEEGTAFKWTDSGRPIAVDDMAVDESGTVQLKVVDFNDGDPQRISITLGDLLEKIADGDLEFDN